MGPWQVRDDTKPFMPGFSTAVLTRQIASGRIQPDTVLRGPSTYQFWMRADQAPGISRLLGKCHACHAGVDPTSTQCEKCGADLSLHDEPNTLGLMYISDSERAAAQRQVSAGKGAPPPSRPAATALPPADDAELSSDSLKPIEPPPAQPDHEEDRLDADDRVEEQHQQEQDYEHGPVASEPMPHDAIDDLWAGGDEGASPYRKRARAGNANGAVIGMLVVSLVVMMIGVVVIVGNQGGNTDADNDARSVGDTPGQDGSPSPPRITAETVTATRTDVMARFEPLDPGEIPAPLRGRYDQIVQMVEQADEADQAKRYTLANQAFLDADQALAELVELRDKYIADAELREEAQVARTAMVQARTQAESSDAQKYAGPDWSRGVDLEALATQQMETAAFESARENFINAALAYEDAGLLAQRGVAAEQAREQLFALMRESAPKNWLEEHAGDELSRVMEIQEQAVAKMKQRAFAEAALLYDQATDLLSRCNELVDQARSRKYYAYLAGYAAADALITLASGDPLANNAAANLDQAMDALALPPEIKSALPRSDAADYDAASQTLISSMRDHLTSSFGAEVQLSYAIGIKARIIEKTLSFDRFTADHRSAVGTGVRELEDFAVEARWNPAAINPALDAFRDAVRKDEVGEKAEAAPAAWAQVLKLMSSRESGLAMMTPTNIEELAPPELFPE